MFVQDQTFLPSCCWEKECNWSWVLFTTIPLLSLALFKLGALMMVPFSLLTTDGRVCVCVRTISRERRRQTNLIAPRSPAVPRAPNYLRGKNISAPRTRTCNRIVYQFHRPDSESFYLSLIWRVGQNISITRRRWRRRNLNLTFTFSP